MSQDLAVYDNLNQTLQFYTSFSHWHCINYLLAVLIFFVISNQARPPEVALYVFIIIKIYIPLIYFCVMLMSLKAS